MSDKTTDRPDIVQHLREQPSELDIIEAATEIVWLRDLNCKLRDEASAMMFRAMTAELKAARLA